MRYAQIFENVNTGGVPLTVFELVTATFAADGFNLRDDWEKSKATFKGKVNGEQLTDLTEGELPGCLDLLVTYHRRMKSGDVMSV
jgi:hypothetical protein